MSFLDVLFGCPHKKLSFPMTFRGAHRPGAASLTGMYVVCLHCGHEFPYDWNQMKVIRKASAHAEGRSFRPRQATSIGSL